MEKITISKEKIFIILVAVLFIISLGVNLSKLLPETRNYKYYTEGLSKYESKSFTDAYYSFGKVSRYSKLKQAAIYRQALCAGKLSDVKSEESKYKQLIKKYPHSAFRARAEYQKALLIYNNKNFKYAKKNFKYILKKYPNTEYAIASRYFIASIDTELLETIKNDKKKNIIKKDAAEYYKAYLLESPKGKYAINCAQKWSALGLDLKNEDNLLIGKTYLDNGNFAVAKKYLQKTSINISWPYLARNAYELKDYPNLRYYTEQGLKGAGDFSVLINTNIDEKQQDQAIYKAIDLYIKASPSPMSAISYLLSISNKSNGHDYLMYKNCNNLPEQRQVACYNTLYTQYPKGNFAAETLSNIFYNKIKTQNYEEAIRIGKLHMNNFSNVKSSPKIIFWIAKSYERIRKYDKARTYYRKLLKKYPDDYYAYHSFLNLNKTRFFDIRGINPKPIEFPYKDSNNELINALIHVKDYGLINILYGDDPFIKSWLLYKQGNYSSSATIARDAIDKMQEKPEKSDLRWRLVYPLHFYDEVINESELYNNDPMLILSIIREESYFNPEAKSHVGAMGLMQLMPATAAEAAKISGVLFPSSKILYNPDINIKLGNSYYSNLKKNFSGKDFLAVLSYNGGIGSVNRWTSSLIYFDVDDFIEQIPYAETQNYLKKVYRSYWNYLRIYEGLKF